MKTMLRNKIKFYYALYVKREPIKDEYGNDTGEHDVIHDNPIEFFANISASKGETETLLFGENLSYDRVIVIDNNSPPIDEYTILWVDSVPQIDEKGALKVNDKGEVLTPHDYIVKKVARSLNSVSIAISKVVVSQWVNEK